MRNVSVFLLSIAALFFEYCYAEIGDYCTTPRREQGECISLINCEPLYVLLKKRPISSASADYLRRSQCGFIGTIPKVCCPSVNAPPATAIPGNTDDRLHSDTNGLDLLPSLDVCGVGLENRIYGGEKADLDDFPWMALIEYERPNRQRGFYCGGVLINSRYVLTAAHCLKGKDLPPNWKIVSVRLGEYNTDTEEDCVKVGPSQTHCAPPAVDVAVEQNIPHKDYDPHDLNQYNDIALLRLIRNVQFSDYIKPICLPKGHLLTKSYVNENLIVAGWGKTETRSESNIKLKLEVPVNTAETCTRQYSQANVRLGNTQLCAGGQKGKDSCRGDSGGPLMKYENTSNFYANWYSVGVVSFGPSPCGMENWPGVYTKVSSFVDWIVKNIKP
ncbi:hypothetical protein ABEB36_002328 [Hypothenemus hampei]|uniref:CLIP domain-containing serine protease n=1 Tax=Hypothenemus hampei TaxID=57062 RepID=A0ABD1F5C2_HYPHA